MMCGAYVPRRRRSDEATALADAAAMLDQSRHRGEQPLGEARARRRTRCPRTRRPRGPCASPAAATRSSPRASRAASSCGSPSPDRGRRGRRSVIASARGCAVLRARCSSVAGTLSARITSRSSSLQHRDRALTRLRSRRASPRSSRSGHPVLEQPFRISSAISPALATAAIVVFLHDHVVERRATSGRPSRMSSSRRSPGTVSTPIRRLRRRMRKTKSIEARDRRRVVRVVHEHAPPLPQRG